MFSCEFCEISKNNFLTKHLRTTASGKGPKYASDQCKGKSETYDDKIVCFIFHYCWHDLLIVVKLQKIECGKN